MSDDSWHDDAAQMAHILQTIVAALFIGTLAFLLIVLTNGSHVKAPPALWPPTPLALVAVVLVGVGLIARAVVLWNVTTKGRREIANGTYTPVAPMRPVKSVVSENDPCRDAKYLLSVFQVKTIISGAMFEGWAFFATMAYMIEGNPISLDLAILLILGVAAHVPTQSRVIGWVEGQLERLEEEKRLR